MGLFLIEAQYKGEIGLYYCQLSRGIRCSRTCLFRKSYPGIIIKICL